MTHRASVPSMQLMSARLNRPGLLAVWNARPLRAGSDEPGLQAFHGQGQARKCGN